MTVASPLILTSSRWTRDGGIQTCGETLGGRPVKTFATNRRITAGETTLVPTTLKHNAACAAQKPICVTGACLVNLSKAQSQFRLPAWSVVERKQYSDNAESRRRRGRFFKALRNLAQRRQD